ncbi:unnamed protein product [Fusarium graminearum]|nr:unnamed protein product [Fusarium graminearum]
METNRFSSDKNDESSTSPSETSASFHEDLMTKYREILIQSEKKAERARYLAEKIVSCILILASLVLPYCHLTMRHLPMFQKTKGFVREIVGVTAAVRPLLDAAPPSIFLALMLSLGTWWFYKQGLRWLLSRALLSIAIKAAAYVVPPPMSTIIDTRSSYTLLETIFSLARTLLLCGLVFFAFRLASTVIAAPKRLRYNN